MKVFKKNSGISKARGHGDKRPGKSNMGDMGVQGTIVVVLECRVALSVGKLCNLYEINYKQK